MTGKAMFAARQYFGGWLECLAFCFPPNDRNLKETLP